MSIAKRKVGLVLAAAVLSLSGYAGATAYPKPDNGTTVQDFRLAGDGGSYADWDYFTPYYSGNNTTVEMGPKCDFFATYGGFANSTKTYWKDASYDALAGYVSNGDGDWFSAEAKRVNRSSTLRQLRVRKERYLLTYPCCGGYISKIKISRRLSSGYYYSYTRVLRSQKDGPNCN